MPLTGWGSSLGLSTDGLLSDLTEGVSIVSIDEATIGDDGGVLITATGFFPSWLVWTFSIKDTASGLDEVCYSGVVGNGSGSVSEDSTTIQFAVPPLPIGGPYDVYVEDADGVLSDTLEDALTVIHRSFTTNLYSLRSAWPPPRDVGPYDLAGED